jgi:hypothetical protein
LQRSEPGCSAVSRAVDEVGGGNWFGSKHSIRQFEYLFGLHSTVRRPKVEFAGQYTKQPDSQEASAVAGTRLGTTTASAIVRAAARSGFFRMDLKPFQGEPSGLVREEILRVEE